MTSRRQPRGSNVDWRPSELVGWLLGIGMLAVVAGVFARRPDVVLLGVPLLGWAVLARTPAGPPATAAEDPSGMVVDAGLVAVGIDLSGPEGTAVKVLAQTSGAQADSVLVDLGPRGQRRVEVTGPGVRTGPRRLFALDLQSVTAGLDALSGTTHVDAPTVLVRPRARALGEVPLPTSLHGLTGAHSSRRPGHGGDLRDVHPFGPGDRLRGIDWRTTARRSPDLDEIYVRRTHATADALVMLVLDSRDDVGPDPATWLGGEPARADEPTSLDVARTAAASIAKAYLDGGDRVGLTDLGRERAPIPPVGGGRALRRIVQTLAVARPDPRRIARVRAPRLTAGALVVILSTFLDDDAASVARSWRAEGHRVIAVDVLPPVWTGGLTADQRLAWRIVRDERRERLLTMRAEGVEVIAWGDGSDPAVHLRRLARAGRRGGRTRTVGAGAS